jgi:hypothetical protein
MMKDVIIKIDQNSMVYKQETVLGISYENLQGKIIFKFLGTFPKGIAYLEYERGTEKGYLQMNQVGEEYQLEIKSSLLKKEGRIYLQLRVTEDTTPEGIPVFKSNKFYLEVKEAINATAEIPDEYPKWIDVANEKIKEMDNLNITTERVEDGVDIVLTDKKGVTTRTEVKDGAPGPQGPQGEPGSVKMQVVDTLPDVGETDTIYLVKKSNPGEQNLYDEYVYANDSWEHIGDTSVDLTDYYTKNEVDDKLATISKVYYWEEGNTGEESIAIFQEMINDLINGGNPILSNKYSNDTSIDADYRIGGSNIYTFPTDLDITTLSTYTGEIDLRRFGYSTVGVTSGKVSRTWVYYKIMIVLKNGVVEKIAGPFKSTAYFNNNSWEGYGDTTILCAENTMAYTPTSNYNPATKKYVDDQITTVNDKTLYLEGTGLIFGDGLNTAENKQLLTDTINKNIGSYFNVIVRDSNSVLTWTYSFDTLPQTTSSYIRTLAPYYSMTVARTTVYIGDMQINYTYDADKGLYNITQWVMAERRRLSITDQDEYISGTKTFTTLPKTTLVPTTDDQFVNKKYVDDQVGNINTILATLTTVSEVSE